MNKRILSVLLVVALLVVGCLFAVQATVWSPDDSEITKFNKIAETYPTMSNVSDGFCPVCGENASIKWEELPEAGGTLTLGKHYYAPGPRSISKAYTIPDPTAAKTQTAAGTVCIHLNGQQITASGANNIFNLSIRSTLNLMGSGTVVGAGATNNAGATIQSAGHLNLFGGTYKHAASTDNATLVQNRSKTHVRIYNGTLFTADQTETQTVYGSNIVLWMGYIHMYGGTIEKGNHTRNISNGTAGHDGLQTFGGNVFVRNGNNSQFSEFNMYGGTIQDGKACKGGNVAVASVSTSYTSTIKFNMYGGEIKNGTSAKSSDSTGGNVYLDARDATCEFNMHGGTVSGGKTTSNGTTIAGNGGNFALTSTSTTYIAHVTVDQSAGTSQITGGKAYNGGNIVVGPNSKLSFNAGTISGGLAGGADSDVNYGGNVYVYASGTEKVGFYQNGGTISGGLADKGGNVAINAENAETVFAGIITGGNHNNQALGTDNETGVPLQMGGNLYVAKGVAIVKNGQITDGESRNGGNIGIEGTADATVSLQNATVSGGKARYTGGNIYMTGTSTLSLGRKDYATDDATEKTLITGGTVSGGDASRRPTTGYGGNIHVAGGTLRLLKGTVTNGVAAQAGGNLYVTGGTVNISGANLTAPQENTQAGAESNPSSYASNIYQTDGTINHTAGTVSGGKGKHGGNLSMVGNSARYILNGGTVEGGYASFHGNNLYLRAGTLELLGGAIKNTTTEVESHDYDGNSVYVGSTDDYETSKLVIGGNMTINTGDCLSDVQMNSQATGLVVKNDFTGDVRITIDGPTMDNGAAITPIIRPTSGYYGYEIGSQYTKSGGTGESAWTTNGEWGAEGPYTGNLTMYASKSASVRVFPVANEATEGLTYDLVTASVRGTKTVDEETTYTWYPSFEAALAGGDDYIALFADQDIEIPEDKTAMVNLNGKDVTVSGAGALTFFDTASSKGALTIADGSTVTLANNSHNGKLVENAQGATYLTVKNDNETYSSYKLKVQLTGVSLRPSTAGIYFRGLTTTEITGAAAEETIQGYGVVVSRQDQPDENFVEETMYSEELGQDVYTNFFTEFTAADLDGEEKTGVVVTGIFKAGEDNAARGMESIYAAAYATVWNGVENVTILDEVDTNGYSMYDVLDMMEDNEAVWTAHGDALNAFFNTWAADLDTWVFDKIGKE